MMRAMKSTALWIFAVAFAPSALAALYAHPSASSSISVSSGVSATLNSTHHHSSTKSHSSFVSSVSSRKHSSSTSSSSSTIGYTPLPPPPASLTKSSSNASPTPTASLNFLPSISVGLNASIGVNSTAPKVCPSKGALEVTIHSQPTVASRPVRGNFASLSMEFGSFSSFFGNSSHPNTFSVQLLKNIGELSGVPLVVRLGGNSQDRARYTTKPIPHANSFGPDLFKAMRGISRMIGTKWVFGINFASPSSNDSILASAEAVHILGKHLQSLSIGNEPEGYPRKHYRKDPYTPEDYLKEWEAFTEKIKSYLKSKKLGPVKFRAGETCCGWNLDELISSGILQRTMDISKIEALSDHYYQLSACKGSHKAQLSNLLSHSFTTTGLTNRLGDGPKVTLPLGPGYVLGETNSVSCGGTQKVSNVFGSALWTIDYALSAAVRNVTMMNFHSSPSAPYEFWATDPQNPSSNQVHPSYYSLLFLAETIGKDRPSIEDIPTGDDSLVVYAVWSAPKGQGQRSLLRIAVLNLALPSHPAHRGHGRHGGRSRSIKNRQVLINLPSDVGALGSNSTTKSCPHPVRAKFKVLTAPNILEQKQISWGGITLESSKTGKLVSPHGSVLFNDEIHTAHSCACGKWIMDLSPGQAALLSLG